MESANNVQTGTILDHKENVYR